MDLTRRDGRAVDCSRLIPGRGLAGLRGFESRSLRHTSRRQNLEVNGTPLVEEVKNVS